MAEKQNKALPAGKDGKEADKGKKDAKKEPSKEGRRFGRSLPWLELLGLGFGLMLVLGLATLLAWALTGPPMPRTLTLAVGAPSSTTEDIGKLYAKQLEEYGVTLELLNTSSSLESLQKVDQEPSKDSSADAEEDPKKKPAQVALIWTGATGEVEAPRARGLASIALQPLWLFHRGLAPYTSFKELSGQRIAIGAEGSECNTLFTQIFADYGLLYSAPTVKEQVAGASAPTGTRLIPTDGPDALTALRNGDLDAIALLQPPDAPLIKLLLQEPGLQLMDMTQGPALEKRFGYLSAQVLPRGVIELASDLPSRSVPALAPAVALIARKELHPALVTLLLKTAGQLHARGDLMAASGTFPSERYLTLPLHEQAEAYFRDGPPFLYRVLSFDHAVLVDANLAYALPLLLLIWPLGPLIPWLLNWRVRVRIYRWYRVLRAIDKELDAQADTKNIQRDVQALAAIEQELLGLWVPLSYMQEFYNLRMHISFIQRKLEERAAGGGDRR